MPVPKVQWKKTDDGQSNCPKHVEFLDKNKFGKLVELLVLLKGNTFSYFIVLRKKNCYIFALNFEAKLESRRRNYSLGEHDVTRDF